MGYTLDDALGYRNNILAQATLVEDAVGDLEVATYEDIEEVVKRLRSEIDDLMNEIPCENGIIEFAQSMKDECDHGEFYHMDDVALTTDDLFGSWGNSNILALNLIKMDDMADILIRVMEDTRIRRTRLAISGLIAELRKGGAYFTIDEDTSYYIEQGWEEQGVAV